MAAKASKIHHTSGIFSDMTVDGPEIGTLVVIVDRAKNLPNRKKIGKQDPYCAARLGKEAKKTEVDKRGGQTPKWDQELRFVVHDSADYYQLKVSVFNDDKKTELIGETWISLETVVVPGGGQSDLWHNLNCKGKYAGDIRIEMTYYDTRPKDEKPAAETRRESARYGGEEGEREAAVGGPRQLKPVKRRPLAPDAANEHHMESMVPDHTQTHLRNGIPSREYRHSGHPTYSPVDHSIPSHAQSTLYYQQPPPPNRRTPLDVHTTPHHGTPPGAVAMAATPPAIPQHQMQDLDPGNDFRSGGVPGRYDEVVEEDETDNQRAYGSHPYVHHQFPPSMSPRDGYAQETHDIPPPPPAHGSRHASPGASPGMQGLSHSRSNPPPVAPPHEDPRQMGLPETTPDYRERGHYQQLHMEDGGSPDTFAQQTGRRHPPRHSHDGAYSGGHDTSYFPQDGPPPPPPAHRSSGNHMILYEQPQGENEYDQAPLSASPGIANRREHFSPDHQIDPSALQRYQPQQDDYPPSAPPPVSRVHSQSASVSTHVSHAQPHHSRQSSDAIARAVSRDSAHGIPPSLIPGIDPGLTEELSERLDRSRRESSMADGESDHLVLYQENNSHHSSPRLRGDADVDPAALYQDPNLAHIPRGERGVGSLVTYQDPSVQQQLHHHQHHHQHHHNQHLQRQHPQSQQEIRPTSSHSSPGRRQSLPQQDIAPPLPVSVPDHRRVAPMIKPRPISPDARAVSRKSASPQPQSQPQQPPEERRLSGMPFSPDSYDALNPNLAAASSINEPGAQYQTPEQAKETFRQRQREAKRGGADAPIYGADGRVIDPSDHLPSDTWAPEPERRPPKKEAPRASPRSRPMPQGAQPMPSSAGQHRGPRDSPASARPVSAIVPTYAHGLPDPQTPPSATRNRLQKKSRYSMPPPTHANSSPIGTPSSAPYSSNGTPRSLIAAEHPLRERENYRHDGSPRYSGVYSQDSPGPDHPPSVPAKIPLGVDGGGYREEDSLALAEELKRIDIGSSGGGRLVRRRQY
ncbi:hypothetical protein GP486_007243 [Trichoglossum hirsutum]|uniref:C2 domain-containing protein n=1 Tax=Trichoglossum hirsutum TaxID=265104 RepID=A0A9P8IG58_9PEZI|nr:hypothetical protein GP486_007243 [Trichoglossum hirsutum]